MDRRWKTIISERTSLTQEKLVYLVKHTFFQRYGTLWELLKPPTGPTPHKSTHSNLMCGLGDVQWSTCHYTIPESRKSGTSSNFAIIENEEFNAHLCSEWAENSIVSTSFVPHE
jgi:hypothetical protein